MTTATTTMPTPPAQNGGWRVLSVSHYTAPGKNVVGVQLFKVIGVSGSRVQTLERLTATQVEALDLVQTWRGLR